MENNDEKINRIIEQLNQKENISQIVLANLNKWDLTEEEKGFFQTYKPEKALIIYGTLAPGRPNYSKMEHINGEWKEGIVKGKLESKGWGAELGYNGFIHTVIEEQQGIEAFVLFSDDLGANWQMLDNFEGEGYKRILAEYELDNGEKGVGYIYALNQA